MVFPSGIRSTGDLATYSYYPTGTVHMVVVDPGVGTTRRPVLASSDAYHFVAPDNGVLSVVYAREERMQVRHITSELYFRQPISNSSQQEDSLRRAVSLRNA